MMLPTTPPGSEVYLTIQQLSQRTGFSVTQLRRLAKKGAIPYLQPGGAGGKLLFRPDALEACSPGESTTFAPAQQRPLSGQRPRWQTT